MSVPGIVESALGDEQVAAQVSLGSEDELYVTPTRVLIYRGEGLLSDETVEEYSHEAERVVVGQGRRKASITLEHDLEGERSFSVPPDRLDDVLHPVLAGVLSAAGVTDPGETVKQTYRFSELTLIITNRRLVKHIGAAVWDADYEEFRFEDTTDLAFEDGSVATQIVMEVNGRRERIKAPNDQAPQVRAHLEEALFEYHDVASAEELRAAVDEDTETVDDAGADDGVDADDASDGAGMAFESGLSPLGEDDADEPADPLAGGDAGASTDQPGVDAGMGDPAAGGTDPDAAPDHGQPSGGDAAGAAGGTGAADAGAGGQDLPPGEDAGNHQAEGAAPDQGAPAGSETGSQRGDGQDASVSQASVEPDQNELSDEELARRLDDIARAVNKQNQLLKRHQETMEKLIDELQRMQ